MNKEFVKQQIQIAGNAYVRNLVAAEEAVLRGQFNVAKVLRALAYSKRAMAMNLARQVELNLDFKTLLTDNLAELKTVSPNSGVSNATLETAQQQFELVNERLQEIAQKSIESLSANADILERDVHQFLFSCYNCGNLVEGSRPEICDICGALSTEFEPFGPFYASNAEHLGQLLPESIIDILQSIPAQLEELIGHVSDEVLIRKPDIDEWCIKEIIGHMIETDKMFVQRVDAILHKKSYAQSVPPWKAQDGKGYEAMSAQELADCMATTRQKSLKIVTELEQEQWAAKAFMLGGMRSVVDTGTWLANHDRGHMVQIQRLLSEYS